MRTSSRMLLITASAFFLIILASCSLKGPDLLHPKLQILLEPKQATNLLSNRFLSSTATNLRSYRVAAAVPTTIGDFSCFAANITGPGVPVLGPDCISSDNMAGFGRGILTRPVPRGRSIEVDLPSGDNRTISIYGVYPPDATCGVSSQQAGSGGGYYLGSKTVNLRESSTVSVPISYGGQPYSVTCAGGAPSQNQSSTQEFGTGADGSLTVTGSIADVRLDTSLNGGRTFSAYDRVININAAGTTLMLTNVFAAIDFAVGDQILWVVMGERNTADCTAAANELYPGKWGTSTLVGANGPASTLTLSEPITATPGLINNVNLTAAFSASNACYIQVVRVPQFNNLTLNSGGNINISPDTFTFAGRGGVLALRVKETLLFSGGGSHVLTASGKGLTGAAITDLQGAGFIKDAGTGGAAANGNGGGGGVGGRGGGGGAYRGIGGDGNINIGSGGAMVPCNGGASTDCAFMGGGGGSANTVGGTGGGLVFIWAKTITGSVAITANASPGGSMAATRTGGGGAGGFVVLTTKTSAATIALQAMGGDGGDGTTMQSGGGGGGGHVNIFYCNGAAPTANVLGGAAPGTNPGTVGGAGVSVLTQDSTRGFCYE